VTDAVERVVEAVILLGGVGMESGGQAAAHAIRNGLAALPELRNARDGEVLPFALLAQLELERHVEADRRDVWAFCRSVGLPVCFADLGLAGVTPAQLARVAERALMEGETIYHEPCALSPERVVAALRAADARGRLARVAAGAC
jgi:glycerol dehydrogenase